MFEDLLRQNRSFRRFHEDVAIEGDIKYWRDASDDHHVPKRPLSELLFQRF